ncbi:MAG: NB-ARC domain-containing protein, partial [Burkholderiales bacterium]
MINIKIVLASSSELKEDRNDFEIFIGRKNKDWVNRGVFLELVVWDDFLDHVPQTRLQDEYDRVVRECDVFVMLFWTKVGQFTEEAFKTAFRQFKAANKPFIFTYFNDAEISTGSANKEDLIRLWSFQGKLESLGHFKAVYKNIDELKLHFSKELDALAASGFIELDSDKARTAMPTNIADQASLTGSGAIAQGRGSTAVGAGGISIRGHSTGNINTGTQTNIDTGGGDFINVIVPPGKSPPAVPFQAPPVTDHVQRPFELAELKRHLLDENGQLRLNTVGLHGFGGAGKTTLARLLCADPIVRRACRDGILWVPLGKNPPDPRAQIADLVTALTGECNGCTTLPGARAQLQAALSHRELLLVIDDVWDEAQIRDIVEASAGCARLITTRNTFTLPFGALLVDVKTMHEKDASRLLGAGLPPGEDARLVALARQLGCWPVLLQLANRALRQRTLRQKMPLPKALDTVERDLARKGVLAFDPARDALERDQAVAATVEASLELLDPGERQRYVELAIFPQDVPIPLVRIAEFWQLTAALDPDGTADLIVNRLDPLSLLEYDGESESIQLHDVLRRYASARLMDRASLHLRLAERWGDRPATSATYAWRWLAFHRAQAAICSEQPTRHALVEKLVAIVTDEHWQQSHEEALEDVPSLQEALSSALDAALADNVPSGAPLVVQAADALVRFRRDRLRPEPIFDLARQGDLDGARRRSALFAIDDHWRQALLLTVAWLAPHAQRDEARKMVEEIQAELGPQPSLHNLVRWIRSDLWSESAPDFGFLVPRQNADEALIEALLKRVGGGQYSRELLISRGLDANAQDPDSPPATRGIVRQNTPDGASTDAEDDRATTRYLAELDGPYLIAYAANDPIKGTVALNRYLSVYTNYSYPEYRFSTLWLLLGFMVQLPRPDGGPWLQDAVVRILGSALGGRSVEFEAGLPIAAIGLRAQGQDQGARIALIKQAAELMGEAARLKPGRDWEGSDVWGHHKRLMLANAQALGWLLGERALARQVLLEASGLADSGFAGYQAPACLAMAEALHVCLAGDQQAIAAITQTLEWAQRAAHNVQDPTF